MLSVFADPAVQVGFQAGATSPPRQHRAVRRQRSLLSESLRAGPASLSPCSSRASVSESELAWPADCSDESASPRSSSSGSGQEHLEMGAELCSAPVPITYSKAAKLRIEAAEELGRKREEQMELLHAVRQYMSGRQPSRPL